MTFRTSTFAMAAAGILGWASFAIVLFKMSPFASGLLALGLFYASLFVALAATGTVINLGADPERWGVALRRGILIALMVSVALFFQRLRVLTWWDGLLLLLIVVLVEFYFAQES